MCLWFSMMNFQVHIKFPYKRNTLQTLFHEQHLVEWQLSWLYQIAESQKNTNIYHNYEWSSALYYVKRQRSLDKHFTSFQWRCHNVVQNITNAIISFSLNVCDIYFNNKYQNNYNLRSAMRLILFSMQKRKCDHPSMLS